MEESDFAIFAINLQDLYVHHSLWFRRPYRLMANCVRPEFERSGVTDNCGIRVRTEEVQQIMLFAGRTFDCSHEFTLVWSIVAVPRIGTSRNLRSAHATVVNRPIQGFGVSATCIKCSKRDIKQSGGSASVR